MTSSNDYTVNFNKNLKVSFNGGILSSDADLLIHRSFDVESIDRSVLSPCVRIVVR